MAEGNMAIEGRNGSTEFAARVHSTVSTVLALHTNFVICQRTNHENTEDANPSGTRMPHSYV